LSSPFEQFSAAFFLRIVSVENFPPRRARPVWIIQPLGDDAFEIEIAHRLERRDAFAEYGLGFLQPIPAPDLRQQRLALLQGQGPHVLALDKQQVEGDIDWLPATEHEVIEPRSTVLAEGDDFAAELKGAPFPEPILPFASCSTTIIVVALLNNVN
jgi:hypothetical protein